MGYTVKQRDLIEDIKDFPIEIVQKMVEEAEAQGNRDSIKGFQIYKSSDIYRGGFNWRETDDGKDFWYKVIAHKNYNIFFEKYPKHVFPKIMEVPPFNNFNHPLKRVVFMYKNGYYYYWSDGETFEEAKKSIEVNCTKYARDIIEEPITEVTLDDIAKKFGVSIDKLRIKK